MSIGYKLKSYLKNVDSICQLLRNEQVLLGNLLYKLNNQLRHFKFFQQSLEVDKWIGKFLNKLDSIDEFSADDFKEKNEKIMEFLTKIENLGIELATYLKMNFHMQFSTIVMSILSRLHVCLRGLYRQFEILIDEEDQLRPKAKPKPKLGSIPSNPMVIEEKKKSNPNEIIVIHDDHVKSEEKKIQPEGIKAEIEVKAQEDTIKENKQQDKGKMNGEQQQSGTIEQNKLKEEVGIADNIQNKTNITNIQEIKEQINEAQVVSNQSNLTGINTSFDIKDLKPVKIEQNKIIPKKQGKQQIQTYDKSKDPSKFSYSDMKNDIANLFEDEEEEVPKQKSKINPTQQPKPLPKVPKQQNKTKGQNQQKQTQNKIIDEFKQKEEGYLSPPNSPVNENSNKIEVNNRITQENIEQSIPKVENLASNKKELDDWTAIIDEPQKQDRQNNNDESKITEEIQQNEEIYNSPPNSPAQNEQNQGLIENNKIIQENLGDSIKQINEELSDLASQQQEQAKDGETKEYPPIISNQIKKRLKFIPVKRRKLQVMSYKAAIRLRTKREMQRKIQEQGNQEDNIDNQVDIE